ncbi:MAG: sodium:solute symporter family protein [Clostridia bacterium]|nr:sodium:solute symporter family protein [Clostridia bacterium]
MLSTIIIVAILYMILILGIGFYGRKYSKSFKSFISMNKEGGILLISGSCIGACIGNGFVVGGAGEGSLYGLAGATFGIAVACTALVAGLFLSNFVYKHQYSSLAEYTKKRYNSDVPGLFYVFATTFSYLGLFGAQLMAGKVLFSSLGLDPTIGVIVIALVVFIYSQLAGIWGTYASSVVQVIVIILGLLCTIIVIFANGGIEAIENAVQAGTAPVGALDFSGITWEEAIAISLPVILGMATGQEFFVRIGTAKSAKAARSAHLLSFIVMVPLAIMPAFIGVYGASLYGTTGDGVFFTVIMNTLPAIVAALIISAVLAAVMSSISVCYSTIDSVVINDFMEGVFKKEISDSRKKQYSLIMNILLTVIAVILAIESGTIIGLLNEFFSILAAACFVPFVGGILWKKGSAFGAGLASIVGMLVVVLGWIGVPLPSLAGTFPLICGAIAFIIGSYIKPIQERD